MKQVFRSSTKEEMPMLRERLNILREAGEVLYEVRNEMKVDVSYVLTFSRTMIAVSWLWSKAQTARQPVS
jgi:hypothetical protein